METPISLDDKIKRLQAPWDTSHTAEMSECARLTDDLIAAYRELETKRSGQTQYCTLCEGYAKKIDDLQSELARAKDHEHHLQDAISEQLAFRKEYLVTHKGCSVKMERMRKALKFIVAHMEIVTNKPEISTVWNIAKAALAE